MHIFFAIAIRFRQFLGHIAMDACFVLLASRGTNNLFGLQSVRKFTFLVCFLSFNIYFMRSSIYMPFLTDFEVFHSRPSSYPALNALDPI